MGREQTFVERKLRADITLSPESTYAFYDKSGNKVTSHEISVSLPMNVSMQAPGLPTMDSATIRIYGMNQEDMGALSYLNYLDVYMIHTSSIKIIDEGNDLTVYAGNIRSAIPNYSEAPNVYIDIYCISGLFAANAVLSPYSVSGTVPVSTLIKNVIAQYNKEVSGSVSIPQYSFEDWVNNPTEEIECGYFSGSLMEQINQIRQTIAGTRLQIVVSNNTIYLSNDSFTTGNKTRPIWFLRSYFRSDGDESFYPLAEENGNAPAQTEDPDSPIIGYPKFEQYGISVQTLFLSGILIGDSVQVDSLVPRVSLDLVDGANYMVMNFSHSLSSRIPGNGAWFTTLSLIPIKSPQQ